MLKFSQLQRLSAAWRPHSEQIKRWIANSRTDPKGLSLARNFIYNLNLDTSLEDLDDGVELMSLLQKLKYPNTNVFVDRLNKYFSAGECDITQPGLIYISTTLKADPSLINLFCSVLLTQDWLLNALPNLLNSMSFEDVMFFGSSIWKAADTGSAGLLPQVKRVSQLISDGLASKICTEASAEITSKQLLLIAESDVPLWDSSAASLATKTFDASRWCFSLSDICHTLQIMARNSAKRNVEWIDCLQQCVATQLKTEKGCKNATAVVADIVLLLSQLSKTVVLPDAILDFLASAVQGSGQCSDDELLLVSLSIYEYCSNGCTLRQNDSLRHLHESIKKRCTRDLQRKVVSSELSLQRIHCLACVDAVFAREAFSRLAPELVTMSLFPQACAHICSTMQLMQFYPKELVEAISASANAATLSQENCIFLVAAMDKVDIPIDTDGVLFKRAVGAHSSRVFAHRNSRKTGGASTFISHHAATMLIRCLLKLNAVQGYGCAVIQSWFESTRLTKDDAFSFLSGMNKFKGRCDKEVESLVLKEAVKYIYESNEDDVRCMLCALADCEGRNVILFSNLLERIQQLEPSFECVVCAARTAHTLKLTNQFSQSDLVKRLSKVRDVDPSGFVLVLQCCAPAERQFLLSLQGASAAMSAFNLQKASAEELFLFISASEPNAARRKEALQELQKRPRLSADHVAIEDIVCTIEQFAQNDPVQEIFRVAGPALQNVNQSQLMRIFKFITATHKCPNIVFRVMGRALLTSINNISSEHALMWLTLYTDRKIRDDGVGKALIRKAGSASKLSKGSEVQLETAAQFYGQRVPKRTQGSRRTKSISMRYTSSYL